MIETDGISVNLDRILKEIIPKDIKITDETIDLLKILFKKLIQKFSSDSSLLISTSLRHSLSQEDVIKMVAKSGFGRYIVELEEELNRLKKEETELANLAK